MKQMYFEPEIRIVKLHGRAHLLAGSKYTISKKPQTNLGDDDFEYEGGGTYAGR